MIYGYIRVSTDRQTVENQRLEIEEWCKRKHIVIEAWIEETISGTKSYSKGQFRGLIHDKLITGDVLIVSELSRMSRKLFEIMEVLKFLMENDIVLKTVKEGYELGDNITSKVLAFAFGLSAEIERTLISQRTKAGLAKRKQDGVIFGRPLGVSGPKKLDGKEILIAQYLESGLALSSIARILKVNRETIRRFSEEKGIRDVEINPRLKKIGQKKLVEDEEIDPYLELLKDRLQGGALMGDLVNVLKEKNLHTSKQALKGYLIRRNIYDEFIKIHQVVRQERNVDCGNYKR